MKSKNLFTQTLIRFCPAFPHIHKRNLSQSLERLPNLSISYSILKQDMSEQEMEDMLKLPKAMIAKNSLLDIEAKKVFEVRTEDIEKSESDKFGSIIIITDSEAKVKYGDCGVKPSETKTPLELLKNSLAIPARSLGVLNIKKHTPFLIETENKKSVILNTAELQEVLNHKENIKQGSLTTVCKLESEDAKKLTLDIQRKIYRDNNKEYFYEEVTSVVYKPTLSNPSSGTLMNFEANDPKENKTTAMHYHPGQRSLHIITANKAAGVTLNFCGVNENPDERKDSEVYIEFPKNCMVVLNFPSYTHHKFHGEFVCMSVHPKEGHNLIEALQSGKLEGGFLESATVFSNADQNQEQWKISIPQDDQAKRGVSR